MTKKRDDRVYLQHILDAIECIQSYLEGISYEQFLRDSLRQDGVVRQLEITGEAANNISKAFKDAHHEVPWGKMIGMRHKLIHNYIEVNL